LYKINQERKLKKTIEFKNKINSFLQSKNISIKIKNKLKNYIGIFKTILDMYELEKENIYKNKAFMKRLDTLYERYNPIFEYSLSELIEYSIKFENIATQNENPFNSKEVIGELIELFGEKEIKELINYYEKVGDTIFYDDDISDEFIKRKEDIKEKANIYVLVGAPGAGKSTKEEEIIRRNKNIISIDTDEYRKMHPTMLKIDKEYNRYEKNLIDDSKLEETTRRLASNTNTLIRILATKTNKNILFQTMIGRSAIWYEEMIRKYKEKFGYNVNIDIMATQKNISEFSTKSRYIEDKKRYGVGRIVLKQAHDEAIEGIEEFISRLKGFEITINADNGEKIKSTQINEAIKEFKKYIKNIEYVRKERIESVRKNIFKIEDYIKSNKLSKVEEEELRKSLKILKEKLGMRQEESKRIKKEENKEKLNKNIKEPK